MSSRLKCLTRRSELRCGTKIFPIQLVWNSDLEKWDTLNESSIQSIAEGEQGNCSSPFHSFFPKWLRCLYKFQ